MKIYIQRTLRLIPRLWMMLTLEIVAASLLYTCLIIVFRTGQSTSFFITFGISFFLAILGVLSIPRYLLLLKDKDEEGYSSSDLARLMRHIKSLRRDRMRLYNATIMAQDTESNKGMEERRKNVS